MFNRYPETILKILFNFQLPDITVLFFDDKQHILLLLSQKKIKKIPDLFTIDGTEFIAGAQIQFGGNTSGYHLY
jgi:hypothetical protein